MYNTDNQLNNNILNTIVEIKKYPELSGYLKEMPISKTKFRVVTAEGLEEYHNSLLLLLRKYKNEHNETTTSERAQRQKEQ